MAALLLELSVLADPVTFELGGPDATLTALLQRQPTPPVVAVVGPPGQNAGDTLDGDRGDIHIQSGQWLIDDIDLGTFN